MLLSPGKYTTDVAARLMRKRQLEKEKQALRAFKRQRLEKKSRKRSILKAAEVREGPTYLTDIGRVEVSDLSEIPAPKTESPLNKPTNPLRRVYFDLETTGFEHNAEIVQIAAVHDERSFERYILPEKKINPMASKATHLTVRNNKLYHRNMEVETSSLDDSLRDFIEFLPDDQSTLIGHNMKSFDARLLTKSLIKTGKIERFQTKNAVFSDTLPLFRNRFPNFKKDGYKQSTLAAKLLLAGQYDAHNAIDDVRMLRDLVNQASVTDDDLFQWSFATEAVLDSFKVSERAISLSVLKGKVSNHIIKKIASSGMDYNHLKLAFARSGSDGLAAILKEPVNGKPRVTTNKRVLDNIAAAFR